ncbi:MAG: hypothetical protein NT023_21490 [Armatimonadetes bacterium]|nr:hypothetical protein [Armatimonadota bacterium]
MPLSPNRLDKIFSILYTTLIMKKTVVGLLDTLHTLALAVWLGGLVILTLLVAPTIFQGTALAEADAREVYGLLLGRFVYWADACGVTMLAVQFLLRRRFQKNQTHFVMDGVRQLLTFVALLLAEMSFRNLLPNLNTAKRIGELSHIVKLQGTYALLAASQAGALLLIAVLTVWLSLPAGGSSRRSITETEEPATPQRRSRRRR